MSESVDLKVLLACLGSSSKMASKLVDAPVLPLAWPEIDAVLPDGGLPRGVVELSACHGLAGATSIALAAICAGQSKLPSAWCAWIDPERTLHAPGVAAANVDLSRMLVVCPARSQIGRIAVKVVAAGAFEVVVIDFHPLTRKWDDGLQPPGPSFFSNQRRQCSPEVLVRKLALSAEQTGTTVLILTDSSQPRSSAWPTALRLDLMRPNRTELSIRIGKERRGRVGLAKTLSFYPMSKSSGEPCAA